MKLRKRFSENLGFPRELVTDLPSLRIKGFEKLILENYKSIVQDDSDLIRINTSSGILKINGEGLDIGWITDEMLEINGAITSVARE